MNVRVNRADRLVRVPVSILSTATAGRTFSVQISNPSRGALGESTALMAIELPAPAFQCWVSQHAVAQFEFPDLTSAGVTGYRLTVRDATGAFVASRDIGANDGFSAGNRRAYNLFVSLPGANYTGAVEFLAFRRSRGSRRPVPDTGPA